MDVSGGIKAGSDKTYEFTLPCGGVTQGISIGTIVTGSVSCAVRCAYDSTKIVLGAGNKNDSNTTYPTRVSCLFVGYI